MKDLKQVLMELGNKLVLEHRYNPANYSVLRGDAARNCYDKRVTDPIRLLTDYLNDSPEAREALKELGFEWSQVGEPRLPTEVGSYTHYEARELATPRNGVESDWRSVEAVAPEAETDVNMIVKPTFTEALNEAVHSLQGDGGTTLPKGFYDKLVIVQVETTYFKPTPAQISAAQKELNSTIEE